jgi:hypothetical protein
MQPSDLPVPTSAILATHFVVARDVETTARFYSEVLGGEVVFDGTEIGPRAPTYVKLANIWIIVNVGRGPTPDRAEIVLDVHQDANQYDTFLNLPRRRHLRCLRRVARKGSRVPDAASRQCDSGFAG